ncbi:hypothetical protein B9G53_17190 [Pseudanabaena sp. SR411]|uniref:hypothetical protein n=1 Tax=Pseudanabaena sp. SR411 TaxID=1980935 RepID=UPI000B98FB76|nr:hypothetical protein [Pseudanabaena sp. SR411]OYQ63403.1 hypothetical protein B9G53_17190 [Pseudanabaena sp. SR411]
MAALRAAILFLDFDFVLTQATAAIKTKRELPRNSLLVWSYKEHQKVNFVNFFDEDLTFEKWDNAKL